jgi:hypothetical protein
MTQAQALQMWVARHSDPTTIRTGVVNELKTKPKRAEVSESVRLVSHCVRTLNRAVSFVYFANFNNAIC